MNTCPVALVKTGRAQVTAEESGPESKYFMCGSKRQNDQESPDSARYCGQIVRWY